MNDFRTAYGKRERHYTEAGSGMKDEYGYDIVKGQKVLIKTGETDLYAAIQAEAEDVKIENIIAKASEGDTSHFLANGIYADVTQFPDNLIEAHKQAHQVEQLWENLTPEIRAKYEDIEGFVKRSGTDEWLHDMGLLAPIVKEQETAGLTPQAEGLGQVKEGGEA